MKMIYNKWLTRESWISKEIQSLPCSLNRSVIISQGYQDPNGPGISYTNLSVGFYLLKLDQSFTRYG